MGCTAGLSLFVLGVVLANSAQGILQVDVEGSESQCFFEELRGGSTLSLAWEVVDSDGWYDLSVSLRAVDGEGGFNTLYEVEAALVSGSKTVEVMPAMHTAQYELCFSNDGATRSRKTVAFDFSVGSTSASLRDSVGTLEHQAAVQNEVTKLARRLASIQVEAALMRRREEEARNTNESTNARVQWFGLLDILIIALAGAAQVYSVLTMFKSKLPAGTGWW